MSAVIKSSGSTGLPKLDLIMYEPANVNSRVKMTNIILIFSVPKRSTNFANLMAQESFGDFMCIKRGRHKLEEERYATKNAK
jgi:hypothetical protein